MDLLITFDLNLSTLMTDKDLRLLNYILFGQLSIRTFSMSKLFLILSDAACQII